MRVTVRISDHNCCQTIHPIFFIVSIAPSMFRLIYHFNDINLKILIIFSEILPYKNNNSGIKEKKLKIFYFKN